MLYKDSFFVNYSARQNVVQKIKFHFSFAMPFESTKYEEEGKYINDYRYQVIVSEVIVSYKKNGCTDKT